MNRMTGAMLELANMDQLSRMDSPIHRRHPLVKLILTVLYIFMVVSVDKEQMSLLIPLVLYPVILFAVSGIGIGTCFYKLRFILPLLCAVGIWNPIFDREPVMQLGTWMISAGMISFLTLLLKGIFALMASFLLIATTNIEEICYALSILKLPDLIVTQILITYRYISLLLHEFGTMMNAYSMRAPGQKGIHISAWGSFVGQLLLRSMDRAQDLYQSMQMRGFTGSFYYAKKQSFRAVDLIYLLLWGLVIVLLRLFPISVLVGDLFLL